MNLISNFLVNESNGLTIRGQEISCADGSIIARESSKDVLQITDAVLLPALFNMHSHLGESIFKDITGQGWTIHKYLEYTENYNSQLSKEDQEKAWIESAQYSCSKMYGNGTAAFCAARSADMAHRNGLITMSGYPIMNSPKLSKFKSDGLDGFIRYTNENKRDNNRIGVFLHSIYSNDEDSLNLAKECLSEGANFLTVHVSEDLQTTELERSKFNMSAVETLEHYGLLSDRTILVHCGFCSDSDYRLIQKRNALVCACPISNVFLNTKMPDLYKLEEMGIPWCIGTDGLATGRTFSLFEQIKTARELYPKITIKRYWDSITTVPARFYNGRGYTGDIEVGCEAVFLQAKYTGHNTEDLLEGLIDGKIEFKTIRF